jgi:hypothetical protein
VATRSKMSLTNEFRMLMARLEIPVSGWTCLRTGGVSKMAPKSHRGGAARRVRRAAAKDRVKLTLVDVGGVGLLPGLGALLLVARGSGRLLASLLLLGGSLAGRGLAAGGGSLLGLGGHFEELAELEMEELEVVRTGGWVRCESVVDALGGESRDGESSLLGGDALLMASAQRVVIRQRLRGPCTAAPADLGRVGWLSEARV